ncbi:MAG: DHHW family protein [Christensenellales bacterium]|jgi:hypothetical protein
MKRKFRFNSVILAFLIPITLLGLISLLDIDPTQSAQENRSLKKIPAFSLQTFLSGEYTREVEAYYADTFPVREGFTRISSVVKNWKGVGDTIYMGSGEVNLGQGEAYYEETPQPDQESARPTPAVTASPGQEGTVPTPTPAVNTPPPDDAAQLQGAVLVVDDAAMELFYNDTRAKEIYADSINTLTASLDEKIRVYSLLAPTSLEFGAPQSYRKDAYSQQKAIADLNTMMQGVIPVDAYKNISNHQTEYVYFRTDHHWTARGAYYAYQAFCQAAGFEQPEALDSFKSGEAEGFLGSYYRLTQSEALKANPDSVEYFWPKTQTSATAYKDSSLQGGYKLSVLKPDIDASNTYMMFIGGDHPIVKITTDAGAGRKIVMIKESFGNALAPWLTNNYDEIWVVDPRLTSFNLNNFMKQQQVEELLIVNYTIGTTSGGYCKQLKALAD